MPKDKGYWSHLEAIKVARSAAQEKPMMTVVYEDALVRLPSNICVPNDAVSVRVKLQTIADNSQA